MDVSATPIEEGVKKLPKWLIKAVEQEWESDTLMVPIHFVLKNGGDLWRQIKKRFPPNPIQATVEMEGEFDERTRIFYQIGSFFLRLLPSIKRVFKFTLRNEI